VPKCTWHPADAMARVNNRQIFSIRSIFIG
jgi:hypothetical protein